MLDIHQLLKHKNKRHSTYDILHLTLQEPYNNERRSSPIRRKRRNINNINNIINTTSSIDFTPQSQRLSRNTFVGSINRIKRYQQFHGNSGSMELLESHTNQMRKVNNNNNNNNSLPESSNNMTTSLLRLVVGVLKRLYTEQQHEARQKVIIQQEEKLLENCNDLNENNYKNHYEIHKHISRNENGWIQKKIKKKSYNNNNNKEIINNNNQNQNLKMTNANNCNIFEDHQYCLFPHEIDQNDISKSPLTKEDVIIQPKEFTSVGEISSSLLSSEDIISSHLLPGDARIPKNILKESLPPNIRDESFITLLLDSFTDENDSISLSELIPFLTETENKVENEISLKKNLTITTTTSDVMKKAYFRVFLILGAKKYPIDNKMRIITLSPGIGEINNKNNNNNYYSPWLLLADQLFKHLPHFPKQILYSIGPFGEERNPPKEYLNSWDSFNTLSREIQMLPFLQIWPIITFPRFIILMSYWGKSLLNILREIQLSPSSPMKSEELIFSSRDTTTYSSVNTDSLPGYSSTIHPYFNEDIDINNNNNNNNNNNGKQTSGSLRTESGSPIRSIISFNNKTSDSVKRINSLLNMWEDEIKDSLTISSSLLLSHNNSINSSTINKKEKHDVRDKSSDNNNNNNNNNNNILFIRKAHPPSISLKRDNPNRKIRRNISEIHLLTPSESINIDSNILTCRNSSNFSPILTELENEKKKSIIRKSNSHRGHTFTSRFYSNVENGHALHNKLSNNLKKKTNENNNNNDNNNNDNNNNDNKEVMNTKMTNFHNKLSSPPFKLSTFSSFPISSSNTQLSDMVCSILQREKRKRDIKINKSQTEKLLSSLSSPVIIINKESSEYHNEIRTSNSITENNENIIPIAVANIRASEIPQQLPHKPNNINMQNWTVNHHDIAVSIPVEKQQGISVISLISNLAGNQGCTETFLSDNNNSNNNNNKSIPLVKGNQTGVLSVSSSASSARENNLEQNRCKSFPHFEKSSAQWLKDLLNAIALIQIVGRGYNLRKNISIKRCRIAAKILQRVLLGFQTRQYLYIQKLRENKEMTQFNVKLIAPPPLPEYKIRDNMNSQQPTSYFSQTAIFVELSPITISGSLNNNNNNNNNNNTSSILHHKFLKRGGGNKPCKMLISLLLQRIGRAYISRKLCYLFIHNKRNIPEQVMVAESTKSNTPMCLSPSPESINNNNNNNNKDEFQNISPIVLRSYTSNRRRSPGVTFVPYGEDPNKFELIEDFKGESPKTPEISREVLQNFWRGRITKQVDFQRRQQQQQQQQLEREAVTNNNNNNSNDNNNNYYYIKEEEEGGKKSGKKFTEHCILKRVKTPPNLSVLKENNNNNNNIEISELDSLTQTPMQQESITPPEGFLLTKDDLNNNNEGILSCPFFAYGRSNSLESNSQFEDIPFWETLSSTQNSTLLSSAIQSCYFSNCSTHSAYSTSPSGVSLRELDFAFPFEKLVLEDNNDSNDNDNLLNLNSINSSDEAPNDQSENVLPDYIVPTSFTHSPIIINTSNAILSIQRIARGFTIRQHLNFSLLLTVAWFEIRILHRAAAGFYDRQQLGLRYYAYKEAEKELQHFHNRNKAAVQIQKVIRGFLARQCIKKIQRKLWVRIELYVALEQQELGEECEW